MWLKVVLVLFCIGIFVAGIVVGHFMGFCAGMEHHKEHAKPAA